MTKNWDFWAPSSTAHSIPASPRRNWQMPQMYPWVPAGDTPSIPNPAPTPLRHATCPRYTTYEKGHLYFLKGSWISICRLSLSFRLKAASHTEHLKGFSPG